MSFLSKIFKTAIDPVGAIAGGGGDGGGGSTTTTTTDSTIGASDNAVVLGPNAKLNEAGIVLDGNATGNTINVSDSSGSHNAGVPITPTKPADGVPIDGGDKPKDNTTLIFWGVGLLVTVLAAIAFSRSQRKSA